MGYLDLPAACLILKKTSVAAIKITLGHQVSTTLLKLLIQQIHPHVHVERDSGMCVARDLYELLGQSP